MNRTAIRNAHALAGTLGFLLLLAFFGATVVAEASGDPALIAFVKRAIVLALIGFVPTMAVAGASGAKLAGERNRSARVARKKRRMAIAAANGLLVLVPCAIALDRLATAGAFGATFGAIQLVELVAGAVNLVLLGLNVRDGLRMRARRRSPRPRTATA